MTYRFNHIFVILLILSQQSRAATDPFDYIDSKVSTEDIFNKISNDRLSYHSEAQVIIINKITANSTKLSLNIGKKVSFGKLQITLISCFQRKSAIGLSHSILVELIENKQEESNLIFKGWLFSESPSLSVFEHPVYQFFPVKCI